MTDTRLSVQLIVRNEETLLPFCLDSVKAIADEIVVVDTGSTDRSIEIARSYGAKIIQAAWKDDFSEARNVGLAHTQANWIFCIDADEVVSDGKESLRELLAEADAEAYWVGIENVLGRLPEERLLHRMVRLFRNKPHYRFRQRLHEQIVPSILEQSTPDRIKMSDLKLTHLGYYAEIKNQAEKRERNERILVTMLAESPQDPFALYNLGIAKEQRGASQEALEHMLAAKDTAPAAAAYRPGLIRDIAKVYLTLDRPDEASSMLIEECARYPDYPDLHFLLGRAYRFQGLYPEAVQALQRAIGAEPRSQLYPVETGTATFRAYTELGEIQTRLGQWEPARACHEKALEFHAGYMPAILGWTAALDALKVESGIIAAGLLQLLARLPDRAGKFAGAMLYLGRCEHFLEARAEGKFASVPEIDYLAALAHLHLKQYEEALPILERLPPEELPDRRTELAQLLALTEWSRGAALPYEFYWGLDDEAGRLYRALERRLWERPTPPDNPELLRFSGELVKTAIRIGLIEAAAALVRSVPSLQLLAAKCLYREGFVKPAADLFLRLLEENALDAEGTVCLAEILYDRGHYGEAAALFEQALPDGGESARIGAALSYLQTARSVLLQAMEHAQGSPLLRADLHKTETGINLLGKIEWRTAWTPAQRRNADVATADIFMHDRQK